HGVLAFRPQVRVVHLEGGDRRAIGGDRLADLADQLAAAFEVTPGGVDGGVAAAAHGGHAGVERVIVGVEALGRVGDLVALVDGVAHGQLGKGQRRRCSGRGRRGRRRDGAAGGRRRGRGARGGRRRQHRRRGSGIASGGRGGGGRFIVLAAGGEQQQAGQAGALQQAHQDS